VEAVAQRGGFETSSAQPGICQLQMSFMQDAHTHLLGLGMHRQPVRIEAFVVCHGGVVVLWWGGYTGSKQLELGADVYV
jgi:hypothetical protein